MLGYWTEDKLWLQFVCLGAIAVAVWYIGEGPQPSPGAPVAPPSPSVMGCDSTNLPIRTRYELRTITQTVPQGTTTPHIGNIYQY